MEIIAGIIGGLAVYAGINALSSAASASAATASQIRINDAQKQRAKAMEELQRKGVK
jgi:hypothetical protein